MMNINSRQIIYIIILLSVGLPLYFRFGVTPARLPSAEKLFSVVDSLPKDKGIALLSFDFGPGTSAENKPQAEVIFEHLLRKRIKVILFSIVPISEPFLKSIPKNVIERLEQETKEKWEEGKDWVNIGYRPGAALFLQGLSKTENIPELISKDAQGREAASLEIFSNVKTLNDIIFLGEFTGLVGVFQNFIQYVQRENYTPILGHGCTSITIPESYIYLDSGQLKGLLEGLAGSAWYSELLLKKYPNRAPDAALVSNTALGISQLVLLGLILAGNIISLWQRRNR